MNNDGRFYELENRKQTPLFGRSLWEAIAEDADVMALDAAVEKLDLSALEAGYRKVGHPAYPPQVMLKILLYGYAVGLRSSRQLDRACRRDDAFRFLAHGLKPDFRPICRFRREHEGDLKELFRQTVTLCQAAGLVSLGHVAIDGTKLRANRSCEAQRELDKALQEAEAADADIPREEESRFMKLPTEGATKPAYNAQLAVDSAHQVIVAQGVVTAQNDVDQLTKMVGQAQENCGEVPQVVSADGGYYNQAEIAELDNITCVYVPSPQTGREAFEWVEGEQAYRCPMGRWLKPYRTRKGKQIYRTHNCTGCENAQACKVTGRFKELHMLISARPALEQLQERMQTEAGQAVYAARKKIIEPVFGRFKHNWGFRRLLLRGKRGAGAEWSLLCIVHNLGKWAEKRCSPPLSAAKNRFFAQLLRRIALTRRGIERFILCQTIEPVRSVRNVNF